MAGVGLGTASRALRDAPGVSTATRDRVLAVAEQMAYVVSPQASSLRRGTTGRVAVVVPHLDRWFFGAMVTGLQSVLREADFDVLLYGVGDLSDRRDFFEKLPARRQVDAVVVVAFQLDEAEHRRLSLMGVRIVAAGGQAAEYPHVGIDDEVAGRQAMDHLIHLGHQRIGMLEAVDPDQPALDLGPLRRLLRRTRRGGPAGGPGSRRHQRLGRGERGRIDGQAARHAQATHRRLRTFR